MITCQACFHAPPPPTCLHFDHDEHIKHIISYLLRGSINSQQSRQYSFELIATLIFTFTKCTAVPIKLALSTAMSECIFLAADKPKYLQCNIFPCKTVEHAIKNDIRAQSNIDATLIALVSAQNNPSEYQLLRQDALFKDYLHPHSTLHFAVKAEPSYFSMLLKRTDRAVHLVSCAHCQQFNYDAQEIAEWMGNDALCPYCYLDAVINMNASNGEIQVTRQLLLCWNKSIVLGFGMNALTRVRLASPTATGATVLYM